MDIDLNTSVPTESSHWRQAIDNGSYADRYLQLSDITLRITGTLEYDSVVREVIDGACKLTGAQYGVIALIGESGTLQDTVTSGITAGQLRQMDTPPTGEGLLGYLNELDGPLRVADIANHPRSIGLPTDHPWMRTFMGVQAKNHDQHVANIYLGDKEDGAEFTELDEEIIVRLAAQAATAITNARKFERERRIKTDLRALVKIAPVGLLVFDATTGQVLTSNQECQRIGGEAGREAMSWAETFETVTLRRADGTILEVGDRPAIQVLQSGDIIRAEETLLCFPDGRTVRTLINAAPIYSDRGEIVSVVVAIQDMTPLEDVERMRGEFLGMVSQELRTPLATIKGSSVALLEAATATNSPELLQLLHIIDQQSEVMRSQVNRLIDLSHIQAGTLTLSLESADVPNLISESIRDFHRNYAGFSVKQHVPDDLPGVLVDRSHITRILLDILSHTAKYSSEASDISVSAEHEDFHVVISVAIDSQRTHSGAVPPLLQSVRPNYRVDGEQGLAGDRLVFAICHGVVEAHGGRFRAERGDSGRGINFTFTVPVAEEPDPDGDSRSANTAASGPEDIGDRPRVLVAANDPYTVGMVGRALSSADYLPVPMFKNDELDSLMVEERPNLVVFHLESFDSEGLPLMNRIFSVYRTPIIALLDTEDEIKVERVFDMGADAYMVKPFSPTELSARIRASLRRMAQSQRTAPGDGYEMGEVIVDYAAHAVSVGGVPVQLTATEYKLLFELSHHAGRVLTQDELLRRVWGPEYVGEPQLLRAYIKSLRQKLGDNARNPSYIYTEHGVGYRMAKA